MRLPHGQGGEVLVHIREAKKQPCAGGRTAQIKQRVRFRIQFVMLAIWQRKQTLAKVILHCLSSTKLMDRKD